MDDSIVDFENALVPFQLTEGSGAIVFGVKENATNIFHMLDILLGELALQIYFIEIARFCRLSFGEHQW
jgi:hypothetical protein